MDFDIHAIPFYQWLGATITHASPERLEAQLTIERHHCNHPPMMHGGVVMSLADNLGGCGAILNLPTGKTTLTIESKTNFLRSAQQGETLTAVSTPVHLGSTLQLWKTEVFNQQGKLVSVTNQTQLIKDLSI